ETVPAGYTGSGTPAGTCSATLAAGSCTITNTLNATPTPTATATPTGSLTISKVFSPGQSGFTGNFTINYDCTGTANDGSVTVAAGGSQTVSGIPTGAVCVVSETAPANPTGWTFGTPTFSDNSGTTTDATVTIGNNTTVT